jgi:hydroxymethylglutaryl-CoA lyase
MADFSESDSRIRHQGSVTIVEVGPRDGLQYESVFFPTEKKVQLVNLLSETGLRRIEVTSFVHPKMIPQLQDAVEVLRGIKRSPRITYTALVPNLRGCERAVQTPVDQIALFVSASETHNRKNVGMSIAASLKGFEAVSRIALEAGKTLRGYVVTAFGCPYEGRIPVKRVKDIIRSYADIGVSEVSLGDTTGMANPGMTGEFVSEIMEDRSDIPIAAHFHNSRGLGLANAYAALGAGVRIFDSSVGGLGGCPTAVGAMGNIPTEDLVNMMEEMGFSTHIDFEKLRFAAAMVKEVLQTELPSFTFKRGRPSWSPGDQTVSDDRRRV